MLRWQEHPACLLNLHPNEIFFFLLIKHMYFPSLSKDQKSMGVPLGKLSVRKANNWRRPLIWEKILWILPRKTGLTGERTEMWNFEVKESIVCLLSVLTEISLSSESVLGNSCLLGEAEVRNATWGSWWACLCLLSIITRIWILPGKFIFLLLNSHLSSSYLFQVLVQLKILKGRLFFSLQFMCRYKVSIKIVQMLKPNYQIWDKKVVKNRMDTLFNSLPGSSGEVYE